MADELENYNLNFKSIIQILNDTTKIFNSFTFYQKNFKISPKFIKILGKQINYNDYKKKYIILIGKGIYGLIEFINKNSIIKKNFKIIALVPDKTKLSSLSEKNNNVILEGNHPIPMEKSIESTKKIVNIIKNLEVNDLIIFFISGGSSSLFCYPNPIYSNNEFQSLWKDLLYSNLTINEINNLRGKIDLVKKGGIISLTNSNVITFYLSDVIGDDLSSIGSGPTIIENENQIDKNFINELPITTRNLIKKADSILTKKEVSKNTIMNYLFQSQVDFVREFSKLATSLGYKCDIHLPAYNENYEEICHKIIFFCKKIKHFNKKLHIWTGEAIVKVSIRSPNIIGGRNQHLLLFLYKLWIKNELHPAILLSFATDGIDGNSPYAGGWINTKETKKDLKSIDRHLNEFTSSLYLKPENIIETGVTGP